MTKKSLNLVFIIVCTVLVFISETSYADKFSETHKKALQGDAEAQNKLGDMYRTGDGVEKVKSEKPLVLRKTGKDTYTPVDMYVGNYPEAVKWYRMAAEQGHAQAQYNLGFMYYVSHQGVPQSYSEAEKWFRKAAEQGHAQAQNTLGVMYYQGTGVARNYSEAVKWYSKAAQQGHYGAQYNLGIMYENGYGVKQDYSEAENLYRKAANQGHLGALEALDRIASLSQQGYDDSNYSQQYDYSDYDEWLMERWVDQLRQGM